MFHETDVLVIGGGVGGLSFAIKASEFARVTVLMKKGKFDSNTAHAQGGIAAVLSPEDSYESHIQDTLKAGDGLCKRKTVELVVKNGPERVKELMEWGVPFDRHNGELELGREGGHSTRRVAHATDFTGREVQKVLVERAESRENVTLLENRMAIDLITTKKMKLKGKNTVLGAYVLNKETGDVEVFSAKVVVLATGGSGKVYLYTSNPDVATGDGVAMAYRAGADICNMEFTQFHPTCLYHPEAKNFLISEAVRGEGAILLNKRGERFMEKVHPLKELAPRDIVARAIDHEMKKWGDDFVYLDISFKDRDFIINRFPNIYRTLLQYGIDMTREPIPVVPAAHYQCGGVKVNLKGETTIRNLFAVGEVSCTGLHGANRLASNSLLEALVFADIIAREVYGRIDKIKLRTSSILPWETGFAVDSDEMVVVSHNWDEIRRLMWNYVGIVRTTKRLERARRRIDLLQEEIREYYWNFLPTGDLLELRNIATVAELIIKSALMRQESRGTHYTVDYPYKDNVNWKHDTILRK